MFVANLVCLALFAQTPPIDAPLALPSGAAAQPHVLLQQSNALFGRQRYFDSHVVALLGRSLFGDQPESLAQFLLLDAHSLWRLGDIDEALALLDPNLLPPPLAPVWRDRFAMHRIWIGYKRGDHALFGRWLDSQADPAVRARGTLHLALLDGQASPDLLPALATYPAASRATMERALQRIGTSGERSPAVAGLLNALLPGAGYARLGMWQSAALSLLLNAATIGATVELGRRQLYFSAATAGLVASFFYVGGIVGAAKSAANENRALRSRQLEALEPLLFPELTLPGGAAPPGSELAPEAMAKGRGAR